MRKFIFLILTGILLVINFLATAGTLPEGFIETRLAEGLNPTAMAVSSDGRVFITEKNGKVSIIKNGVLRAEPFIELDVDDFNERGLQGLAFHPNFDQNNWVYFYYTAPDINRNVVVRVLANGDIALPQSDTLIFEMDIMEGSVHNGGAMAFGQDGKLYIGTGEGGLPDNSSNLNNVLGAILRINDDGGIPDDNPLLNVTAGKNEAIYAYGFRNPFSFSFDPQSGRFFVNDVGGSEFEEINEVLPGKFYGWPSAEGTSNDPFLPANYENPLYAYSHDEGCAILGSGFYSPEVPVFPPEYQDLYFFADYCNGTIQLFDPLTNSYAGIFASDIIQPVALTFGPEGEMYYLERSGVGGGSVSDNTGSENGVLWKVSFTGSGAPFISVDPDSTLVSIGETAVFEVLASGAPPLVYQWRKDGQLIPGANGPEFEFGPVSLDDDASLFRCRVSNAEDTIFSEFAELQVTSNQRPIPLIESLQTSQSYRAGDTLFYSGQAIDPEEGLLDPENLSWRIDFHHNDHTHPAMESTTGINQGQIHVPVVGETSPNVFYRIYLTATDSEGLSQTVFQDVFPEKIRIRITADQPGVRVVVNGNQATTPYEYQSVIGINQVINAPQTQVIDGVFYTFESWEQGPSSNLYSFFADEADMGFRVLYQATPEGNGFGLLGAYFNDPTHQFVAEPVLTRIDSTINFNWGLGSPDPSVDEDFISIRWGGQLEPLFSDVHDFSIISDDGVRLWIDSILVIDNWVNQAVVESNGQIFLEKGKRYPITLEYFADAETMIVGLFWSTTLIEKQVVPASQLYYEVPLTGQPVFRLAPNPVHEILRLQFLFRKENSGIIKVLNSAGQLIKEDIFRSEPPIDFYEMDVKDLSVGVYFIEIESPYKSEVISFIKK